MRAGAVHAQSSDVIISDVVSFENNLVDENGGKLALLAWVEYYLYGYGIGLRNCATTEIVGTSLCDETPF